MDRKWEVITGFIEARKFHVQALNAVVVSLVIVANAVVALKFRLEKRERNEFCNQAAEGERQTWQTRHDHIAWLPVDLNR